MFSAISCSTKLLQLEHVHRKAVEGRRTPGCWRRFVSATNVAKRPGVRQPSGALEQVKNAAIGSSAATSSFGSCAKRLLHLMQTVGLKSSSPVGGCCHGNQEGAPIPWQCVTPISRDRRQTKRAAHDNDDTASEDDGSAIHTL